MRQALLTWAALAAMLFHAQLMLAHEGRAEQDVLAAMSAPMMDCCETAQTGHGAPVCAAFFPAGVQVIPADARPQWRNTYVIEHWRASGLGSAPPREPPRAV